MTNPLASSQCSRFLHPFVFCYDENLPQLRSYVLHIARFFLLWHEMWGERMKNEVASCFNWISCNTLFSWFFPSILNFFHFFLSSSFQFNFHFHFWFLHLLFTCSRRWLFESLSQHSSVHLSITFPLHVLLSCSVVHYTSPRLFVVELNWARSELARLTIPLFTDWNVRNEISSRTFFSSQFPTSSWSSFGSPSPIRHHRLLFLRKRSSDFDNYPWFFSFFYFFTLHIYKFISALSRLVEATRKKKFK